MPPLSLDTLNSSTKNGCFVVFFYEWYLETQLSSDQIFSQSSAESGPDVHKEAVLRGRFLRFLLEFQNLLNVTHVNGKGTIMTVIPGLKRAPMHTNQHFTEYSHQRVQLTEIFHNKTNSTLHIIKKSKHNWLILLKLTLFIVVNFSLQMSNTVFLCDCWTVRFGKSVRVYQFTVYRYEKYALSTYLINVLHHLVVVILSYMLPRWFRPTSFYQRQQ